MKKTLIAVVVVLVVGISAAAIAHKHSACRTSAHVAASTDSCCPASQPASADASAAKPASCPYMQEKQAQSAKNEPKHCPASMSGKGACKSAKACQQQTAEPVVSAVPSEPAAKSSAAPAAAKEVKSAVCPVMGSKIPDVSKAAGHSVYKGKTYYFCCGSCKPQFDKDPEKYVGS